MRKYLLLLLALSVACPAHAVVNKPTHRFLAGPFKTGPEVTKACMECHAELTRALTGTVHWNWGKKQSHNGKTVEYGKKNALGNTLCLALPSNHSGCTGCHAGYGWVDASFDFGNLENIDCLICHDTTGTYKKFPFGGGHPVYAGEKKEYPAGKAWEPVDLLQVARWVDRPTRAACGNCHFYGGGGDNYKHGDLDSSLANPSREIDVHMGAHKLTCESCHKGANHDVRGEAISVSLSQGSRAMGCTDCHKGDQVHKFRILNKHMLRVACQACHIPTYATTNPTVLSWDWSAAGKELSADEMKQYAPGEKLYDKAKGELTLGRNLIPSYFWYNGALERVLPGDKIDPGQVVRLSAPKGERKDPNARIMPFKILKGKQPYDAGNQTVAVVNFYGEAGTAYTESFNWNKAIEAGMKAAALSYSGKYGWIETTTAWSINHMVVPKEKALRCHGCHGDKGRIDWKSLGYPKDPR